MRASTVFALALSLLVGLAAAAGAKYAGLFNRKEAPPVVTQQPAPHMVLVPRLNLYADVTVTSDQVVARPIRPEEEQYLHSRFGATWREKLMPALPTAAHQRTPRQDLLVDQMLFKEYFHESGLPDNLSLRLEPNTRAVNVSVTKEHAGGGVLQLGEHVDVFLTTRVSDGERDQIRTACIARSCKIIMKRNNLWRVAGSDPETALPFTLQANLYRAALLEYARTVGTFSLMPVPSPPKTGGTFSDPNSREYATEDRRIEEVLRGERTIGDDDLARIFNVKPAGLRPTPAQPHQTQHLVGVNYAGVSVFPSKPVPVPTQAPVVPAGGVNGGTNPPTPTTGTGDGSGVSEPPRFGLPSATGDPGCKTCGGPKAPVDPYRTVRPGGGN